MADWSHRAEYIFAKHQTKPDEADEALRDPYRAVLDPDPASKSGTSVRTIGYSSLRDQILTVITVEEDGVVYGVNAWASNNKDRRLYMEEE